MNLYLKKVYSFPFPLPCFHGDRTQTQGLKHTLGQCSISELHSKPLVSHFPISLPFNFISLFLLLLLIISSIHSGVCGHMGVEHSLEFGPTRGNVVRGV